MVYSNFRMNKTNKLLIVALLFLMVSSLATSRLAQQNRDNRSKATNEVEVVNSVCGAMNNTSVTKIPDNRYACAKGAVNWMDSVADDGAFNWDCIGKTVDEIVHCEALLGK